MLAISLQMITEVCSVVKLVINLQWLLLLTCKEVNPRLAKRLLVFNGRLANCGLTSLVKEAKERQWKWLYEALETTPAGHMVPQCSAANPEAIVAIETPHLYHSDKPAA